MQHKTESFVRILQEASISMPGIKVLLHKLEWILLTLTPMNMMCPRMTENNQFCREYSLYAVLDECLNTDHMKSLAHPYGEDADIVYFD
jgi:hypothetical protein